MSDLPQYLRSAPAGATPQGNYADAPRATCWLREHIRPFAQYQAMLEMAGIAEPPEGKAELLLAAIKTATDAGWSREIGIGAAEAEWRAAVEQFRAVAARVVHAVKPLTYRREPGEQVLAAAKAADYACMIPTEILIQFCARIAQAGAPRRDRA